ncbi:hypothetical protein QKW60_08945 [Defluviimonas aestuarii]|uniref:hypothetical protein n=1 Tax=Albidovulum aestuarii TaxID=1130726 RepID=UPI00249BBAF6|nr:hypothetical protein [Defluviimonas aestuarii]MDI3336531.1 hypothetical protein [Defluviimonas aestuarii]
MGRSSTARLTAFLIVLIAILGTAPILKGAFYLGKHEGDTMHLAELVLRMADGQWPHLDFMTPIGVLALAPMAVFVKAGAGLGHAIFYSQILVAAVLLLPVLRVATSRLTGFWPYAYGGFVMLLCLALVHGEAQSAISISMHYNRWAWAVSYIIIPLAVLAPHDRPRPWLDGMLIGIGLAALVLTKVTYVVALGPGMLIAILARRNFAMLASAVLSGLTVMALFTAFSGFDFWLAYVRDLLTVALGDSRPSAGMDFGGVVADPLYMGGSLTLIAAVIFLRQAGRSVEGLAMLILMPGFFYVAYQNFGNDPQWLYLVALFAFLLRPEGVVTNGFGWDMRVALTYTGALALAFGAPSAINLAFSPWRHLAAETEGTVPLMSRLPAHDDIMTFRERLYTIDRFLPYDLPGDPFEIYREDADRKDPVTLNGETLADCGLESGISAWFELVTDDLEAAGYAGSAVMGTDLYSAYWMFGDFRPVKGAAPWYYGGAPGIENADYVAVPLCPMSQSLRASMLESIDEGGWTLREVRRTPLYILTQPVAP